MIDENRLIQCSLPVLAAVAYLLSKSQNMFVNFILWHFQMGFHELGHAIAAWMTGQIAIPTYAYTVTFGPSEFFYAAFLFGLSFAAYYFRKENSYYLAGISGSLILISLILRVFTSHSAHLMIFSLGGFLGEIIISTILICGFYFHFPNKFRWDFFRYFFVLISFFVLFKSNHIWTRAQKSPGHLPMGGTIMSETEQSDTEKLLDSGYWTGKTLPAILVRTHKICFVLITLHYLVGLVMISPTSKPKST
jgi:hypothetical protein